MSTERPERPREPLEFYHRGRSDRLIPIMFEGGWRYVPRRWWAALEGPKPPYTFVSNGCSYSPDVLPVSDYVLWPACVVHDWHYGRGPALSVSRWKADRLLAKNIWRLMRQQGAGIFHSAAISTAYFQGVRRFGGIVWRKHRARLGDG